MSKSQNTQNQPPSPRVPAAELQAHLAAIVESSDDAIVSKSLNGIVQSWNAGAERIFGYTAEEMVGKPIILLFPPDRLSEEDHFLGQIRRGERVDHFQTVRVRKDGQRIDISVTLSPIRDASGTIVGVSKIARDITEVLRLNQMVKESEARFRLLANSIPQLAWMARPDGWLFWYNDRWYEYTGMPPQSQEGWGWEQVHDAKELPRVIEKWKAALATGEPWEDSFPLRRHDGEMRWHLSRALPLRNARGEIVYWFGTNTDITEQLNLAKQREELLNAERAARSEAERVSRMKDEFLATLSHELRTPLNAILGWSQILKRGADDPETLSEGVAVIERNTRAQTQLIDDLLDMSRIISGKIRLDVQRIDLVNVVDLAVNALRPAAEARQIQVRKVLDPNAGPVSGDPNRLQQVVWNLLSNAIKFTPKLGTVEVLLERVDSQVRVTVSDTGQGISPEFLPHVFERFRQADATTTRRHGGLGLGLSIVKHLVELHGGKVEVSSEGIGNGATFSFTLPLLVTRRDPEEAQLPPAETGVSLKGLTVLVVDDERDARDLLARLLEDTEARVLLEDSAAGAIRALRRERPDILISDIGMPGVDGYQLIREVRALHAEQGGRTPAIALTAFARSEDRTRAMMAGYHVHLSKPIEPSELIATVATLAGRTGVGQS